ncbi:MAG: DUF4349 domain-containing protein [Gemmatimonadaceae bacterium]
MQPLLNRFRANRRAHAWLTPTLVSLAVMLAACSDKSASPMQSVMQERAEGSASRNALAGGGAVAAPSPAMMDAATKSAPVDASQTTNASAAAIVTPTMVIRNGSASIEVDSLELAIAAVHKLAASMGGYVGNTTQTTGEYSVRSADIELKIPAARYDATVNNLGPIGKVESQTSTAEDVGEEFVDVTARQANAHRLEERLITLLATRTGKLEDVLAVERELARVREEIERYEGRLRYLKSHASISTLMVSLHEKRAVVSGYEGTNVIVEAFKNAWRNFVSFVAILISSLGWIIPLGVLALIGFIVVRRNWPTKKNGDPQ